MNPTHYLQEFGRSSQITDDEVKKAEEFLVKVI